MTEPNFSAIRARLRYDSVDEFIDGYSRYVTAGGMFIPMTPAKLKPVGTTVRFQFVLGDGATALLGEGVVRQIRGLENEDTDSPIGMLVKFTKLSQDSKILIDRIIALKEIEKLGVDIFSEDAYSDSDSEESEEHAAATGSYAAAELVNAASGLRADAGNDDELGELFTDRTGRLEASELAGLGASTVGANFDQPNDSDANVAAVKPAEAAKPFQEWGPEPEEEVEPAPPVDNTGSGELGLDLFTFNTDDFETPATSDLFSSGESSNELSFDFDFDMSGSEEPAVAPSPVNEDFAAKDDLFGEKSGFSMDDIVDSFDALKDSDSVVADDEMREESEAQEEVVEVAASEPEEQVTTHVVRETLGGLQIKSFDGSADASIDRDFEQFAAGSEDDVDSMFDDVFGDAFDGAFGGMDDAVEEELVEEEVSEPELASSTDEQVDVVEEVVEETVEEVAAEIEALEQAAEIEQPSDVSESVAEEVSDEQVEEDVSDAPSEESLAALLFGEESESLSADVIDEDIIEEPVAELEVSEPEVSETKVSESASDELELSEEFDLSEISEEQPAVVEQEAEEVFDFNEFEVNSAEFEEPVVDEVISEMPVAPALPPMPPAQVPAPPAIEVKSTTADLRESGDEPSENSSELLSLLGALEASEAEKDGLTLGSGLLLSHGLQDESSPVLEDEPDSFSALLASAQKELDYRNVTSETDRQRDAIDELLGDDELPLPPIPSASPFAMPEFPEKKRKGFISKLFGKD